LMAFSDSFDPSVGTRMCLYIGVLRRAPILRPAGCEALTEIKRRPGSAAIVGPMIRTR
jgi:hypothetical protein